MVDGEKEKKDRQQAHLRVFNNYFPSWNREAGVIKQIREDLKNIKELTDLEEKYQKANFSWTKHSNSRITVIGHYSGGDLHELVNYLDTIEKYHKLVEELWELKVEISREKENASQEVESNQPKPKTNQPKKNTQNTNHQTQNQPQTTQSAQEDYTYCPQCPKKIKDSDKYWYHTIKNDNRKFCSKKCLINYYGEYCLTCKPYQKYLDIYRLDENDSFGYCWDCYQEQIRKLEELEKERAATEKRIEEQKKEQETWEKAQVKHNHLEHSPQSREREREREREHHRNNQTISPTK